MTRSLEVYGVFGELSVPMRNTRSGAQLGRAMYEDLRRHRRPRSIRVSRCAGRSPTSLALRSSVQAPPSVHHRKLPSCPASSSRRHSRQAAGGYKPYRQPINNPDLKPETATAFNVGAITKFGGFAPSLDIGASISEDVIENESGQDLIARFYQGATVVNPAPNCGNPALAALQAQLPINNGVCGPASTALVLTDIRTINGSDVKISGIDASLQYELDGVLGGIIHRGPRWHLQLEVRARRQSDRRHRGAHGR